MIQNETNFSAFHLIFALNCRQLSSAAKLRMRYLDHAKLQRGTGPRKIAEE